VTRLERLDIHGVRGIRDLSLPFDGGSIVLGGANGTGKSACVDAVELLYTGSIATLSGTQGISLRQHGAHVRVPSAEAQVTAQFRDPEGSVTRQLSGQLDVPAALEGHMARGAQLAFILRRSQLQHFIHAKPADRYRSMADLIGAEVLDRTEAVFKSARDALENQLLQGQAVLARVDGRIAELPEPADDDELMRTANERLESMGGAYRLVGWDDIRTVRAAVLRDVAAARQDRLLEARARASQELNRGIGADRLREAIAGYREVTARDRPQEAHLLDLLHLLRRGRDYLREQPADRCPVCERDIRGRVLFDRLVERVAQLEEVSLHEQRVERAAEDLTRALRETGQRLAALEPLWTATGLKAPSSPLADALTMVEESVRGGAVAEGRDLAVRTLQSLDRWESWAVETLTALEAERPPPADDGYGAEGEVLNILEGAAAQRAAAERGRQELSRLLEEHARIASGVARSQCAFALADQAFRTFNRTKNAEIQRVYDDLQNDLARMYDVLHPGEGHGAVAIIMDQRKRGSSDLRMGFYGREDDDPRAFASEGHLDSLGLCIFLAFARRFNGDWPLLVLDDVVATVDAAHKVRVAHLLLQEFGDRQLLITTHDSRWFRELQRLEGDLGETNVRNLAIESWSLEEGPRVRELGPPTSSPSGLAASGQ
jgi:recombinational DNA repair ATPase RecF